MKSDATMDAAVLALVDLADEPPSITELHLAMLVFRRDIDTYDVRDAVWRLVNTSVLEFTSRHRLKRGEKS